MNDKTSQDLLVAMKALHSIVALPNVDDDAMQIALDAISKIDGDTNE